MRSIEFPPIFMPPSLWPCGPFHPFLGSLALSPTLPHHPFLGSLSPSLPQLSPFRRWPRQPSVHANPKIAAYAKTSHSHCGQSWCPPDAGFSACLPSICVFLWLWSLRFMLNLSAMSCILFYTCIFSICFFFVPLKQVFKAQTCHLSPWSWPPVWTCHLGHPILFISVIGEVGLSFFPPQVRTCHLGPSQSCIQGSIRPENIAAEQRQKSTKYSKSNLALCFPSPARLCCIALPVSTKFLLYQN